MAIGAAIGSVVGGLASASAAKKGAEAQAKAAESAAQAQLTAARESNALQKEMFYKGIDLSAPWRDTGQNALAQMAFEMGIGPDPASMAAGGFNIDEFTTTPPAREGGQGGGRRWIDATPQGSGMSTVPSQGYWQGGGGGGQPEASQGVTRYRVGGQEFDTRGAAQAWVNQNRPAPAANSGSDPYAKFRNTPGYKFGLDEGTKAITRDAAARGNRFGGDVMKGLMQFGRDYSDQAGYTPYWNRLASMAGTGQVTAGQQAGMGQNYANAAGNNLMNANMYAGNARMAGAKAMASGYMGGANALNGTMNSLFSVYGGAQAGLFGPNPFGGMFGGTSRGGYSGFDAPAGGYIGAGGPGASPLNFGL